jgi:hypothetical protein
MSENIQKFSLIALNAEQNFSFLSDFFLFFSSEKLIKNTKIAVYVYKREKEEFWKK